MKVEYKNVNIFEIDKDKKGTLKVVNIINWKKKFILLSARTYSRNKGGGLLHEKRSRVKILL